MYRTLLDTMGRSVCDLTAYYCTQYLNNHPRSGLELESPFIYSIQRPHSDDTEA